MKLNLEELTVSSFETSDSIPALIGPTDATAPTNCSWCIPGSLDCY